MKLLHFLFILLAIVFVSCLKEPLTETSQVTNNGNTAPLFTDDPCPELEDHECPFAGEVPDMDLLFGEFPGNNDAPTYGLIDHFANCPATPIDSECFFECEPITITFGYNEFWVRSWFSGSEGPCNEEGILTIAEQQSIIDDAIAIATNQAPICAANGNPMEPIHYDFFWDAISPTGGTSFFVGVHVTYTSRCYYRPF